MELLLLSAKEMLSDAQLDGDKLRIKYALLHLAFLDDMARLSSFVSHHPSTERRESRGAQHAAALTDLAAAAGRSEGGAR